MTKYEYIADQIRNQIIISKELLPSQMLPTETELCEKYETSKMTVKKALDALVVEGLIYKKRGMGTFVKSLNQGPIDNIVISNKEQSLTGFSRQFREQKVSTKVISHSIIAADEALALNLNIAPEDFVYQIIRVRYLDEIPVVHEETYMPIEVIPGLKRCHAQTSIYAYIEQELNYVIQSSHVCIKSKKCPSSILPHLNLKKGEPIAEVTQIAFLDNGRVFEYSISSHHYSFYEFHTVIVKRG